MLLTFLILFRESLEAFLLVGILIAYLYRLNAARYTVWIYAGVVGGLIASIIAAFVLRVLVDQFSNEYYRALLTAAIMLVATRILTYMAIWMGKQARAHTEHAKERLESYISARNVVGIAMLAFVSVWREGLETVLFLSALSYNGQPLSLVGGLIGFVLAITLVVLLITGARRVPLHIFFRCTSLLLIVIAAGLLGSAVATLQGAGVTLGPSQPLFDISGVLSDSSGLGVFLRGLFGYNATPTLAQFVLWLVYLVIAVNLWRRGYASARPEAR